jgi:hypothetical protein
MQQTYQLKDIKFTLYNTLNTKQLRHIQLFTQ